MVNASQQRLSRQLNLIPYIFARGTVNLELAAQDLGTTRRQISKDLHTLWMCGLPGYGPGELIDLEFSTEELADCESVSVSHTAGMNRPVRLTSEEALSLELALHHAAHTAHPTSAVLIQEAVELLRGAREESTAPDYGEPMLEIVDQALAAQRLLHFSYGNETTGTVRRRVVLPVRIFHQVNRFYIDAWCIDAQAYRTFRYDRIHDVQLGESPDDATLGHLANAAAKKAPQAQYEPVRFVDGAQWFSEENMFTELHTDDGVLNGKLRYYDPAWRNRVLLGHSDKVRTTRAETAAELAEIAGATAAKYAAANVAMRE